MDYKKARFLATKWALKNAYEHPTNEIPDKTIKSTIPKNGCYIGNVKNGSCPSCYNFNECSKKYGSKTWPGKGLTVGNDSSCFPGTNLETD